MAENMSVYAAIPNAAAASAAPPASRAAIARTERPLGDHVRKSGAARETRANHESAVSAPPMPAAIDVHRSPSDASVHIAWMLRSRAGANANRSHVSAI